MTLCYLKFEICHSCEAGYMPTLAEQWRVTSAPYFSLKLDYFFFAFSASLRFNKKT